MIVYLKRRLYFLLIFSFTISQGQIDRDAIFSLPRLTNTEMLGIANPYLGSILYNTDDNNVYKFDGTSWVRIDETLTLDSVILNREGGYTLPNATNVYFDFPINANHIQSIDTDVFEIIGDGEIRVLESGVYLISAELSTSNLPSGDIKYILGAFRNGTLIGYLTRGSVNLPNTDWWGASGVLMYNFTANDEIRIRYVLNAGQTLTGRFINIGITKMK